MNAPSLVTNAFEYFWQSTGCQAVIFDMDGTLVDNMDFHRRTWMEWAKHEGLQKSEDEILQNVNGTIGEIVQRLFPHIQNPDEIFALGERKEALYRELYRPHLQMLPGLIVWLNWLKDEEIPLAVATAGDRKNLAFTLDGLGIRDYFQVMVTGEDTRHGKPHPEVFLRAAEGLNMAPKSCLVFEDSPAGTEAARRAEMPCVVVNADAPREKFGDTGHVLGFIHDFTALPFAIHESAP
jgi:beta-phosphoglucomutase family hydrolase